MLYCIWRFCVHKGRLDIERGAGINHQGSAKRRHKPHGGVKEVETTLTLLWVGWSQDQATIICDLVEGKVAGWQLAESGRQGRRLCLRHHPDAVIINLGSPDREVAGLARALRIQPDSPALLLASSDMNGRTRSQLQTLGMVELIEWPPEGEAFFTSLRQALQRRQRRNQNTMTPPSPFQIPPEQLSRPIIGSSLAISEVMRSIRQAAGADQASVLLIGETGTGKELAARAIHELSERQTKPFVAVNCAAIPETLLEGELFGYKKGAFTDALRDHEGYFRQAHGGTLFLDEITSLPSYTQAKLLRVLQEREVQPLGSATRQRVDFRLIAAASPELKTAIREGRFRGDLYYRLHVLPIHLPPLRERREDIPELVEFFGQRFAQRNNIDIPEIPPETIDRMLSYDWPGNVRELENFVERSLVMYSGGLTLSFSPTDMDPDPSQEWDLIEKGRRQNWSLRRLTREYMLAVLEKTGGNCSQAARILEVDRRTITKHLEEHHPEGEAEENDSRRDDYSAPGR